MPAYRFYTLSELQAEQARGWLCFDVALLAARSGAPAAPGGCADGGSAASGGAAGGGATGGGASGPAGVAEQRLLRTLISDPLSGA